MSDDLSTIMEAVQVDQIILRALLWEVVTHRIASSENPEIAKREILSRLYRFVDGYDVPETSPELMEVAREKARRNVDALLGAVRLD